MSTARGNFELCVADVGKGSRARRASAIDEMFTYTLIRRAELDAWNRPRRHLEAGGCQMDAARAQCRVDFPVAAHRSDLELDAELLGELTREIVLGALRSTVLGQVVGQGAAPCCNAQLTKSLDLIDQTRQG